MTAAMQKTCLSTEVMLVLHVTCSSTSRSMQHHVTGGDDNCSSATAWSQVVANTFLAPFGLGSLGGTVSMRGTNGKVYERVRDLLTEQASSANIQLARPG